MEVQPHVCFLSFLILLDCSCMPCLIGFHIFKNLCLSLMGMKMLSSSDTVLICQ